MATFPTTILPLYSVLLLFGALVFVAAVEDPLLSAYEKWMSDFGRVYGSDTEKQHRFEVFKANFEFIESTNKQPAMTYTLGLNEFADLTNEEFVKKYVGFKSPSGSKKATPFKYANLTAAPTCVNWRTSGAVTPVKDQRNCSSCWAFSATGAMEGINKIKTGTLLSLSEQELLDCDFWCSACNGGSMYYAFQWVIWNGGITTESDYPYTSGSTGSAGSCNYPKTYDYAVSLYSYQDLTRNCESCLRNAAANQPISVIIDASGSAFQFYKSGIFTGPCGTNRDHCALVVGYGPCSTGTPYWLVKNSWGTSWGESGYICMQRNVASTAGLCGIAMEPSYPLIITSWDVQATEDAATNSGSGLESLCRANPGCYIAMRSPGLLLHSDSKRGKSKSKPIGKFS
ncbi:senescence-specific cysteine protease SAG39-like [Carex rostrata]